MRYIQAIIAAVFVSGVGLVLMVAALVAGLSSEQPMMPFVMGVGVLLHVVSLVLMLIVGVLTVTDAISDIRSEKRKNSPNDSGVPLEDRIVDGFTLKFLYGMHVRANRIAGLDSEPFEVWAQETWDQWVEKQR